MQNSPFDFYKKLLGRSGENRAVALLKKSGVKILKRNWKTPFGEADIVAQEGEYILFVEVKTRSSDRFSTPAAAVDGRKQKRYRDIANYYYLSEGKEVFTRFDVVEVTKEGLNWIKNAF